MACSRTLWRRWRRCSRIDTDVAEVVARLGELGDRLAGIDIGEATDVNELRARVTALVRRVDLLEGRAP